VAPGEWKMLVAILAVLAGVAILAWSADQFVLGAARVALVKRVPTLVVGVVIVGFGTSAPELLVSVLALIGDEPEVAVGNVVGSNIANLSLLLGIGALLIPLTVDSRTVKREAVLVVVAVILLGLALQGDGINRWEGAGLLSAMAVALFIVSRKSDDDVLGDEVAELADASAHSLQREVLRTLVGLAGTIGAAQLLLWGALDLADRAGLSGGFVGATLVAIGTSLPELVTVVQSARRKEADLIVGNLLGSNLFNALVVGGTIGLIGGPPLADTSLTVIGAGAAVAIAVFAALAMRTERTVTRREGAMLVVAYLALIPLLA
jgi:cation:H+ antiporter